MEKRDFTITFFCFKRKIDRIEVIYGDDWLSFHSKTGSIFTNVENKKLENIFFHRIIGFYKWKIEDLIDSPEFDDLENYALVFKRKDRSLRVIVYELIDKIEPELN